jgi:hypothetical protein
MLRPLPAFALTISALACTTPLPPEPPRREPASLHAPAPPPARAACACLAGPQSSRAPRLPSSRPDLVLPTVPPRTPARPTSAPPAPASAHSWACANRASSACCCQPPCAPVPARRSPRLARAAWRLPHAEPPLVPEPPPRAHLRWRPLPRACSAAAPPRASPLRSPARLAWPPLARATRASSRTGRAPAACRCWAHGSLGRPPPEPERPHAYSSASIHCARPRLVPNRGRKKERSVWMGLPPVEEEKKETPGRKEIEEKDEQISPRTYA